MSLAASRRGLALLALLFAPGLAAADAGPVRDLLPVPNAVTLSAACEAALDQARERFARLRALPMEEVGVASVLEAWDRAEAALEDVTGPAGLMAAVHPDRRVREAADACTLAAAELETELLQDEALYRRVEAVRATGPAASSLRRDLLQDFEDSGVSLPPDRRRRAREIRQRLAALRQEFNRNLRNNRTRLHFSADEIRGLSESYLAKVHRTEDGGIEVGFDYPEYRPFMASADDPAARRRYYVAFTRRGGERNVEILDEVVALRKELAGLYGFPSYAAFALRRKMAERPGIVWDFLDSIHAAVDEVQQAELAELAALKARDLGSDDARIERWDLSYYMEKLRRQRFAIDQEATRRYFPTAAAIAWAIRLSERLYGLRFAEAEVPVWHPEVRYFDVFDAGTGERLGGVYLDPFPREGKYKHAAAFGVRAASTATGRRPISVLVTNFDREGLSHGEAETLLHEFGHVLHGVLSRARYARQAGTRVERDFVEAPSQIFEEWARRREGLAVLAEVCGRCPVIDDDLLRRLNEARRFGQGIRYARQHLYASFDMVLAGAEPRPSLEVWSELEGARPLGHVPGTQFPGAFGHIVGGYAAGYYGYMWSEALALDMLSAWGDDLMDPRVGRRFRRLVLERGGEVPARQLVEDFLGRPASRDAFVAEITGRRGAAGGA